MSAIARLEHELLSKQLLEAELDNLVTLAETHEMQLSLHILSGRNLPISIHSKVHRQVKFTVDNQIYESRFYTCEGLQQTSIWNETHLVSVKSYESCLKLVYIDYETSTKPLGGAILKLTGFFDQKRHDGWYDIGCGELRLAIRFIHDTKTLYKDFISLLSGSIKSTEKKINQSYSIVKDTRLVRLYEAIARKAIEDLGREAKILRFYMEKSASVIQKKFRGWKMFKSLKDQSRDIRSGESNYQGVEHIEVSELGTPEKSIENFERSSEISEAISSDVPPYIQVVEKTCKRRIAVKRY